MGLYTVDRCPEIRMNRMSWGKMLPWHNHIHLPVHLSAPKLVVSTGPIFQPKYKKTSHTSIVLSKKSPFGNSLPAVSKSLTYPTSLAIELTMFGNWILTATGSSRPVGDTPGDKTAVWTWPMEAAAKGILSKLTKSSGQEEPKELVNTCWGTCS